MNVVEAWHHRQEIFKKWHELHKAKCPNCVVDEGSRADACAEYQLIQLIYWAVASPDGGPFDV